MGNKQSSSKDSLKKTKSFKQKVQSSKENLKQLFQLAETVEQQQSNVLVSSYPINTNGEFINDHGPIVVDLKQTKETTPPATINRNLNGLQKNTINDILLQNIKQNTISPRSTPITPHSEQMKRDLIANMFTTPQLNIDLAQINQNAPVKPRTQPQNEQVFFDPRSPTIKRNPISKESLKPFSDLNKFMELSPLNLEDDDLGYNNKDAIVVLSNTQHNIIDILNGADIQLGDDVLTNQVANNSLFEDDDLIKRVFVLPSPIQPYDPNSQPGQKESNTEERFEDFDDLMPPSPPALSSNLPIIIPQSSNRLVADPILDTFDFDCTTGIESIEIINLDQIAGRSTPTFKNNHAISTTPKLVLGGSNSRQRDIPSTTSTMRTPKRKNSLNPPPLRGYVSPSPLQTALSHQVDNHSNNSSNTTTSTSSNLYMTPQTPNDEDLPPQNPNKNTPIQKVVNKENVPSKNSVGKNVGKPVHKNVSAVKKVDKNDLRAKSIQRNDGALVNISNRVVR